jgi:hypothetical protein
VTSCEEKKILTAQINSPDQIDHLTEQHAVLKRDQREANDVDRRPDFAIGQEHGQKLLRHIILDVILLGAADQGEADDEENRLFPFNQSTKGQYGASIPMNSKSK